jgi:putative NADH-flavin reductase
MNITIFGATGNLGKECLLQCLEAGHEVTVLARSPEKIPDEIVDRITVIQGDALSLDVVERSISKETGISERQLRLVRCPL